MRKRIAYLTRTIDDMVGMQLLGGVIEGAKNLDIDLTVFQGDKIGESGASILYDLVGTDAAEVDGVITWASTEINQYIDYYRRFTCPLVSLSLKIENHPVAAINCYDGMILAMEHLITEHHYTKIGFIRGPEDHTYAIARFAAYRDALMAHHIPLDDRLISVPAVNWETWYGAATVGRYFDELKLIPGKDLQVIAGDNDSMIIGAYHELQRRGIKVPSQIALMGFNNIPEGQALYSTLSTVSMPFPAQGIQAVEILSHMMEHRTVPQESFLQGALILRESCGCPMQLLDHAGELPTFKTADSPKTRISPRAKTTRLPDETAIAARLSAEVGDARRIPEPERPALGAHLTILARAFLSDLAAGSVKEFIKVLSQITFESVEQNQDVELWHLVLGKLRAAIIPWINLENGFLVQSMFEQARILLGNIASRIIRNNAIKSDARQHLFRQFGGAIISTHSVPDIIRTLETWLPRLSIPTCFLVAYENPGEYRFPGNPAQYSRLLFALRDGKRSEIAQLSFLTKKILPDEIGFQAGYSIVLPLFFQASQIGYIVFANSPIELSLYNLIKDQLASALQGALLFDKQRAAEKALEETLATMKTQAGIVSQSSHGISDKVGDISSGMEELSANVTEIEHRINDVMAVVTHAVQMAKKTGSIVADLKNKSGSIGEITRLISDIAEKTNILALNASIEAARAREAGKGFSVVAREVKELAAGTVASVANINSIIEDMRKSSGNTDASLNEIVSVINQIMELSTIIKDAIREHSSATAHISGKLLETVDGSKQISQAISAVANLEKRIAT